MIKEVLDNIIDIYIELNRNLEGNLISEEELTDIKNSLDKSFNSEYSKLLYGIDKMRGIDFSKLDNPNDENYLEGMVSIYTSLNRLENYFIDLREAHVQISKTFRHIAGDLSLKENKSPDDVYLEDEETGELIRLNLNETHDTDENDDNDEEVFGF